MKNGKNLSTGEGIPGTQIEKSLAVTFARIDAVALGFACGFIAGLWVFLATIVLVIRGGEVVGPNLGLLSQFFIGYHVTWTGAILGFLYGCGTGFIFGFLFASMRNLMVRSFLISALRRSERETLSDLL